MMWSYLLKIAFLVNILRIIHAQEEHSIQDSFKHGLEHYLNTKNKTEELNETLKVLQLPYLFRVKEKPLVSKAACVACNTGIGVVIAARRRGMDKVGISTFLTKLCVWLKIEPGDVCYGAITTHTDTLLYVIDNKKDLSSERVCSILMQQYGCKDPKRKDWTIDIPPLIHSMADVDETTVNLDPKSLRILQLTDIHFDPGYGVGSNAACESPICCQMGTVPTTPENAAGFWGDYRDCDLPWHAITDSINQIIAQHKDLDLVYFTGDIVGHKSWNTSVDETSKAISDIYRKLNEKFERIPLYPILGNHEPFPINLFSPDIVMNSSLNTQWIFNLVADEWMMWLPIETRGTILKGGFYTTLVKPGFRIVALNSNVCYTFNWWLIYDDVDPYGQLQWLIGVLLEAEKNAEIVHILAHIPSGESNCLYNWNREYIKIINRFSHIIAAQFNGHTHYDDTLIFYNTSNPSQPINVAFNGGSFTTWVNLNPNYKIYTVAPETMEVLDFESWTYNITDANLTPYQSPKWYKLYSFKSAYNVDSLEPKELNNLVERIAKTPELIQMYFRFKHREADTMLAKGCDYNCEIDNLCAMVNTDPEYYTIACQKLTAIYNSV